MAHIKAHFFVLFFVVVVVVVVVVVLTRKKEDNKTDFYNGKQFLNKDRKRNKQMKKENRINYSS